MYVANSTLTLDINHAQFLHLISGTVKVVLIVKISPNNLTKVSLCVSIIILIYFPLTGTHRSFRQGNVHFSQVVVFTSELNQCAIIIKRTKNQGSYTKIGSTYCLGHGGCQGFHLSSLLALYLVLQPQLSAFSL